MTSPTRSHAATDAQRRRLVRQALVAAAAAAASLATGGAWAQGPRTPMQLWKSPSCGCCAEWQKIVEAAGFAVTVHDVGNTSARKRLKIPAALGSCHTALVAGYAIEGHVPVADIRRLLAERPDAVGLAVPGMPIGSPGMDGPEYGGQRDRYEVLLVLRDGSTRVFSRQG